MWCHVDVIHVTHAALSTYIIFWESKWVNCRACIEYQYVSWETYLTVYSLVFVKTKMSLVKSRSRCINFVVNEPVLNVLYALYTLWHIKHVHCLYLSDMLSYCMTIYGCVVIGYMSSATGVGIFFQCIQSVWSWVENGEMCIEISHYARWCKIEMSSGKCGLTKAKYVLRRVNCVNSLDKCV